MLNNRKSRPASRKSIPVALPATGVAQPGISQATVAAPNWSRHALGAAMVALWAALLTGIVPMLPTQLASWLTFFALFIAPGYLLVDMLSRRLDLDWVERLALAFPLGIALMAVPGIAALLLHVTIDRLALGWTVASAVVVVGWMVFTGFLLFRSAGSGPTYPPEKWRVSDVIWLLLLAGAYAAMLPALMLYKIDGDAYAVNSFAADALAGLPLNRFEPLFGTDIGPGVRMVFNQSLPMAYLWSYWSGIPPLTLTAEASRPMVALWAILAAYMLGKAAGASSGSSVSAARRLGLLTASIQVLIYLASPFLRGDNVSLFFFERVTADKFMVPVTMLPVVFACVIRFVRSGQRGAWIAAAVASFAVATIHPLIAAMLALGAGAFGLAHIAANWRERLAVWRAVAIWSLAAIAMSLPVVQLVLSQGEAPLAPSYPSSIDGWPTAYKAVPALPGLYLPTLDVYGPLPDLSQLDAAEAATLDNPFLIWRFAVNAERRRLLFFSLNNYISDPNILLEPPYLLALLLLPFLLLRIRKREGAQFALATSLAILFVMFNPLVTPLLGAVVMPWILWRFVWLLPYALIMALAIEPTLDSLSATLTRIAPKWLGLNRPNVAHNWRAFGPLALLAAITLLASPAIATNLHTLHDRAGFPYYFPTPHELLGKLEELTVADGGATVLADQDLSVTIGAYVARANVIAHRVPTTSEVFPADRQVEALQRLIDQDRFFQSRYLTTETLDVLRRYDVAYIVSPSGSNLDIQLRMAPDWFEWLLDDQSYSLYAVREISDVTPAVEGNTFLADRRWAQAERAFHQELNTSPNSILALSGLAEIAHARGEFNGALSLYQRALRSGDLPMLHYRLGQIYLELGQLDRSIEEFELAQTAAPRIGRFHIALGDACLSVGDDTCAGEQYAAAVANQNLPDEAAYLIALADIWRQRGRTDRSLNLYEQAAALQPSEANQLMLVSAYQEVGRYAQAESLLNLLRVQRPFSAEVLNIGAGVKAAQQQHDSAISLYRQAIWMQELTGQESTGSRLLMAQTLLAAGRLDEAQRTLDRVLAVEPKSAVAHSLLGDLHSRAFRSELAMAAYQEAFRLDPTQVQLYLALSNQYRRQGGGQDDVLQLLQTAIRANPDEATLALAFGDQLQRRGETQAAIEAYQSALDMFELYTVSSAFNPRTVETSRAYAYVRLAAVSEDLGQMEPAMNYYGAAVAAAPDLPWTQVLYGDALRRRNDMAGAEAAYRRAMLQDPTFVAAYVQLADLVRARGNSVEAEALQQQALALTLEQSILPVTGSSGTVLGSGQGGAVSGDNSAAQSFNSDFLSEASAGDGSSTLSQILAQLTFSGDWLFGIDSGANVLYVLARSANTADEARSLESLYLQALEQGRREGWYPVAMAQYYKGLGDLYLSNGQAMAAHDAYRSAVELDDWWPQARLGLAAAFTALDNDAEAIEQLRAAVEIAPGYVEAQIALAAALAQRNRMDEALEVYLATAETHSGNPAATLALARAWQDRGEWEHAEHNYRKTIAMNPGVGEAYVDLSALLITQARYDEAEQLLQQALATDSEQFTAMVQYGILEQHRGNRETAMNWFRAAGETLPEGQPPSIVLIDLLQRYGDYATAQAYLQMALQEQPASADLLVRQARLQRQQGDLSGAMNTLLSAARQEVSDSRLSAELGELYIAQGRPQAAVSAYRQTIVLEPTEASYYQRLAELRIAQAEFDQAEAILKTGIQRALRPAPLYSALADFYVRQGKPDLAKTTLEAGLAATGDSAGLVLAMGTYLESRAVRRAVSEESVEKWFTDELARRPNDAALHIALANHYLRRQNSAEALPHFERALALAPTDAGHYLAAAVAYASADKRDLSLDAYTKVTWLEPTLVDAYRSLAAAYQAQSKWDEARAVYEQGLSIAPTDGELFVAYSGFILDRGDAEVAAAMLAEAAEISPTPETYIARAAVYSKMRRYESARNDLHTAVAKAPGSIDARIALGDFYRDRGDVRTARSIYTEVTQMSPGATIGQLRLAQLTR